MRAVITVPRDLLRQTRTDWDIDPRQRGAAARGSGLSVTHIVEFPVWIGTPQIVLHGDGLRQWRAWRWAAEGTTHVYRIAMKDAAVQSTQPRPGIPFEGGGSFEGGVLFAAEPFVVSAAAAAAGATALMVSVADPALMPVVGQIMSHEDWPFGVVSVTPGTGDLVTLGVRPALRRAIPAGVPVLCEGVGLFELLEGGNAEYGLRPVSRPEMQFREYLNR